MKQRIFWFQDGMKLSAQSKNWSGIDEHTMRLVQSIGHPDFEHSIVDPLACLTTLFKEIQESGKNFSVVIDLTQQLQHECEKMFPITPIISSFHISRLRKVSFPRLDGSGFLLSMSKDAINTLTESMNMSRPLIIDDVGWSGRSVKMVAETFGIQMEHTTFGFLVANNGVFGEKSPGATLALRQKGADVISGMNVETPNDDGFHLADFIIPKSIVTEQTWQCIQSIQLLRESTRLHPESENQLHQQIGTLLKDNQEQLFPHAMNTEQLEEMKNEGRVVGIDKVIHDGTLFDINPPNWLMPSLSKRIRSEQLENQKDTILEIILLLQHNPDERLRELHGTSVHKERC